MTIPNNLDECIELMERNISEEDKKKIMELPEDEICAFHFTTGMSMRNNWGLWGGSPLAKWFNSIGIYHADDMSGIILTTFHRTLNGAPIDLKGQVAYYENYWIRSLGNDGYERMKQELLGG